MLMIVKGKAQSISEWCREEEIEFEVYGHMMRVVNYTY